MGKPEHFQWPSIALTCTSLLFLPETPRFLVKQDKHEQATASLAKLRRLPEDHPAVVEELAEIVANHHYEMSIGTASYAECFKGTVGKRLMTGCFLQALQQLTGVNFIVRAPLESQTSSMANPTPTIVLLRYPVLPERRFPEPLHHLRHHQLGQRRLYIPRSVPC